ncbi:MAG: lytic murein transglycosylase B [Halochromatium sp.]
MPRSPLIAALCVALSLGACGSQPAKQAEARSPFLAAAADAGANSGTTATANSRVTRGDYAGRADVARFIDRMQARGLDRGQLVRIFERTRADPSILKYMDRQWRPASGPTGAWTRYRGRHITPAMIAKGSAFWARHASTLERASRQYGVPPEYIVAILGIETRWGGFMGTHRIIDALATLAFDYPRRADYFQNELAEYLLKAEDQDFDPLQPVGSFAGAMGLGQFMPSSWRDYAVDFNDDGRRDLWDPEDAIGSVAHYLQAHGWQPGAAVVVRASGGAGLPWATETGFKSDYSVAELRAKGIRPAVALADDRRVSLLRLDASGGLEYWLGFENFYVITRYNHSTYYAMTVHQLAEALRARRGRNQPSPRVTEQAAADGSSAATAAITAASMPLRPPLAE